MSDHIEIVELVHFPDLQTEQVLTALASYFQGLQQSGAIQDTRVIEGTPEQIAAGELHVEFTPVQALERQTILEGIQPGYSPDDAGSVFLRLQEHSSRLEQERLAQVYRVGIVLQNMSEHGTDVIGQGNLDELERLGLIERANEAEAYEGFGAWITNRGRELLSNLPHIDPATGRVAHPYSSESELRIAAEELGYEVSDLIMNGDSVSQGVRSTEHTRYSDEILTALGSRAPTSPSPQEAEQRAYAGFREMLSRIEAGGRTAPTATMVRTAEQAREMFGAPVLYGFDPAAGSSWSGDFITTYGSRPGSIEQLTGYSMSAEVDAGDILRGWSADFGMDDTPWPQRVRPLRARRGPIPSKPDPNGPRRQRRSKKHKDKRT